MGCCPAGVAAAPHYEFVEQRGGWDTEASRLRRLQDKQGKLTAKVRVGCKQESNRGFDTLGAHLFSGQAEKREGWSHVHNAGCISLSCL